MKTSIFILLFTFSVFAAKGNVTNTPTSCDWFSVQTTMGYSVLEWYGGATPDKDDIIVGDFESYGMKTVFNITQDRECRVWVEEYWLSKSRMYEKLYDKCD